MENLFEILATDLKIDKTAIQTAVEKHNIFLLDNEKLSSLKKTVQDESYNKAHGIAYKNAIKDLAAKFEFEIDPSNDFDTVKSTFETKIKEKYGSEIEKIKADFSKSKDEKFKDFENKINEYDKSISKLQQLIKSKDEEFLKEKNARFSDKAFTDFLQTLSRFKVIVPTEIEKMWEEYVSKYIAKQHEIAETIFNKKYYFKFDESGKYQVYDKEKNEVVKDNFENPKQLTDIVTSVVTDYLSVTKTEIKGKGEGDKTKSEANTKLSNIKNEDDLFKYIDTQNINRSHPDAVKIYSEWSKLQQNK